MNKLKFEIEFDYLNELSSNFISLTLIARLDVYICVWVGGGGWVKLVPNSIYRLSKYWINYVFSLYFFLPHLMFLFVYIFSLYHQMCCKIIDCNSD